MTVVFGLIGVLNQIRELAKEDSDSPLIKECKNLMRETLEILDGIEEADDPDTVEKMLSDFGDLLATAVGADGGRSRQDRPSQPSIRERNGTREQDHERDRSSASTSPTRWRPTSRSRSTRCCASGPSRSAASRTSNMGSTGSMTTRPLRQPVPVLLGPGRAGVGLPALLRRGQRQPQPGTSATSAPGCRPPRGCSTTRSPRPWSR